MRWFDGLFDDLEPGTREQLDATKRFVHLDTGEDMVTIDAPADRLHVVRSGRVKAWRPVRSGDALTLFYLGAGGPIGLLAVANQTRYLVTVTATEPVTACWWPMATVIRLLGEDAHFALNGMRILGRALQLVAERLEDVSGAKAEQQLGRALLRLAGEQADWHDDGTAAVDVSRQELADLTGSTLYTASRTLSDWGRQGLVESSRGRVVIKDPHALAVLADIDG